MIASVLTAGTPTTAAAGSAASGTPIDLALESVRPAGPETAWVHEADAEFVLLTIEWAGTDTVAVRTAHGDQWSPWSRLEPETHHDEAGDLDEATEVDVRNDGEHASRLSQPLWVGRADRFEVDTDGIDSIVVHLITSTDGSTTEPLLAPAAAPEASGGPTIRSRSSWNARTPEEPWDATDDVEFVAIHHTGMASHVSYSPADVPTIIRAIQTFHIDGRGWNDIGYNYLIDRYGTIWEGRGGAELARLAAHAAGFNTASAGVAFIGDHQETEPTEHAMAAATELVGWLWFIHDIDPTSTFGYTERTDDHEKRVLVRLVGHRDVGNTTCPGALLHARLPELGRRAAAVRLTHQGSREAITATITGPAGAVRERGDFNGDGRADLLTEHIGTWRIWWGHESQPSTRSLISPARGAVPSLGDFDGDGLDDLLWWGHAGAVETWYGTPDGRFEAAPTELKIPVPEDADEDEDPTPRPFRDVAGETAGRTPIVGDFDGDGDEDIVWHHERFLNQYWWSGRTFRHFESQLMLFPGGGEAHTGDYDGDTIDDVIWFSETGDVQAWFGHPDDRFVIEPVAGRAVPPGLLVVDLDDVEGDDLVWNRTAARTGSAVGFDADRDLFATSTQRPTIGRLATGDLDGDAHRDVVTVNGDQATVDFGGPNASTVHRSAPAGEPVVVDFDGDGLDDVIWVNAAGTTHTVWRSAR